MKDILYFLVGLSIMTLVGSVVYGFWWLVTYHPMFVLVPILTGIGIFVLAIFSVMCINIGETILS